MIVDPAGCGDDCNGDRDTHQTGIPCGMADPRACRQYRHDNADATAARRGRAMRAALAGLVVERVTMRVKDRQPDNERRQPET